MKLTIKLIMFIGVFMFLGTANVSGQNSIEVLKGKLSELKAENSPSTQPAAQVGGVYKAVGLPTVDEKFYTYLLDMVADGRTESEAVNETYQLFSKEGRNPRILRLRNEAISLLNL